MENEIRQRWAAIKDIRGVLSMLGQEVPNPALLLKEIITDNDIAFIELLESKSVEWEQHVADQEAVFRLSQKGARASAICDKAYNLILGWNLERGITPEQEDAMEAAFTPIMMALSVVKNAGKAYRLIEQVTPDGVLVTQEMKDQVLGVLADAADL